MRYNGLIRLHLRTLSSSSLHAEETPEAVSALPSPTTFCTDTDGDGMGWDDGGGMDGMAYFRDERFVSLDKHLSYLVHERIDGFHWSLFCLCFDWFIFSGP